MYLLLHRDIYVTLLHRAMRVCRWEGGAWEGQGDHLRPLQRRPTSSANMPAVNLPLPVPVAHFPSPWSPCSYHTTSASPSCHLRRRLHPRHQNRSCANARDVVLQWLPALRSAAHGIPDGRWSAAMITHTLQLKCWLKQWIKQEIHHPHQLRIIIKHLPYGQRYG